MGEGLERVCERLSGLGIRVKGLWCRCDRMLAVPAYERDEGAVDCGGFGASVAHDGVESFR